MAQVPLQPGRKGQAVKSFFEAPHRPFFPLSALWALIGGVFWLLSLQGSGPEYASMAAFHAPMLILGFGGAATAGFMLTSLPGWTKRPLVSGALLTTLVLAWALGQIALGFGIATPLVVLFPLALGAVMLRSIYAAKVWPRLWALLAPVALGVVALAYMGWPKAAGDWLALHPQAPVLIYLVLLSLVGARSIIGFGRNFLLRSERPAPEVAGRWEELLALGFLILGIASYLATEGALGAVGLLAAAAAQVWRLRRFWLSPVWREPLLAVLLGGFAWLPIGLFALALARLEIGPLTPKDALHGLTMGLMGGMIAAMAGRAAARRVAGALVARPGLLVACGLIWLATALRMAAPFWPETAVLVMSTAAALWCLGWLIWLWAFIPALRGPVIRPVLSGSKVSV
ncbi:NnrS family protein [Rhodobacter ferrooxidans]|uniref:NnrS family protein n=1 Tax=Rhodobacter ferrooxidans TaxID=371731 RepID=C8RX39_9RHOB|nr:NnrS family protein [Rhodobacter sp. SW2]EEW26564.1 NnrS family protein [Rhodobacter sp. SW2]